MITIDMYDDGFLIDGHAEYDDYGNDIVCASVSTILQLAKMGLTVLAQQYHEFITINYDEFGGMGK